MGDERLVTTSVAVRVFKRATSLGGVESLIEHRRSTEGPSSPVPDDLLRLSIGLEAPEDLIADLEAALAQVSQAGAGRAPTPAMDASAPTVGADMAGAVAAVVERSVAPSLIAVSPR